MENAPIVNPASQQACCNEFTLSDGGSTHYKTEQTGDGRKRKVNAPQKQLDERDGTTEVSQKNYASYCKTTDAIVANDNIRRRTDDHDSLAPRKPILLQEGEWLFRQQYLHGQNEQQQQQVRDNRGGDRGSKRKRRICEASIDQTIDCCTVQNCEADEKVSYRKNKKLNREEQPNKVDVGSVSVETGARIGRSYIEQADNDDEKQNDAKELSYPLDGLWEMSWKSYPIHPTKFVVLKHRFKMFDFMCKVKLGGSADNYCPSFQWPVQITAIYNPIFQKSKLAIPPGTNSKEWPTRIKWTTTDPNYGEITWTRLNPVSTTHLDTRGQKSSHSSYLEKVPIEKREELEKFQRRELEKFEKARNLAEGVISLQTEDIDIIAQANIIRLAKRLLDTQKDFSDRNIPIHVDIAYHHTRSENLRTIQTSGLLSLSERKNQNIVSKLNGSVFGDGIYCSSDPTAHANRHYGNTTILLARMKGIEVSNMYSKKDYMGCNTIAVTSKKFCVLQYGNQCIPLFRFPSHLLISARTNIGQHKNFPQKLSELQEKVQILLDKIFNDNVPTKVDNAWILQPLSQNKIYPLRRRFMKRNLGASADSQFHTIFGRRFNPVPVDGPFVWPDMSPLSNFNFPPSKS